MTVEFAFDIVQYVFIFALIISLVRVLIGPSSADRLVGLNLVAAQILAILVLIAVKQDLHVYLDVALVYDIFGFLGLIAIARFYKKREEP